MLSQILSNIEIADLVPLRAVNTRWQGVIKSYLKKSLILSNTESNIWFANLWVESDNFDQYYELKSAKEQKFTLSLDFCTLLHQLFSNLEELSIQILDYGFTMNVNRLVFLLNPWSSKLIKLTLTFATPSSDSKEELCTCLNSMTKLKELVLDMIKVTFEQLQPTLARLERFSARIVPLSDPIELVRYMGPKCTHLGLDSFYSMDALKIRQWIDVNPPLFGQLTHLKLPLNESGALDLICEHATALQKLSVEFETTLVSNSCVYNIYKLFLIIYLLGLPNFTN